MCFGVRLPEFRRFGFSGLDFSLESDIFRALETSPKYTTKKVTKFPFSFSIGECHNNTDRLPNLQLHPRHDWSPKNVSRHQHYIDSVLDHYGHCQHNRQTMDVGRNNFGPGHCRHIDRFGLVTGLCIQFRNCTQKAARTIGHLSGVLHFYRYGANLSARILFAGKYSFQT